MKEEYVSQEGDESVLERRRTLTVHTEYLW